MALQEQERMTPLHFYIWSKVRGTYVDLMVMQRSCSSLRVSVKRVSPARDEESIRHFGAYTKARSKINVVHWHLVAPRKYDQVLSVLW